MLAVKVMEVVERRPGITDRELSESVFGTRHRVQQINGECRHLKNLGRLERKKIGDQPIGNWPVRQQPKLTVIKDRDEIERLCRPFDGEEI